MATNNTPVPVLVTTKHRGVFFGFAAKDDICNEHIALKRCRCAIRWNTAPNGFLALAKDGPNQGSRIGSEADEVFLRDVTSVTICTDNAAAAWTSHANS